MAKSIIVLNGPNLNMLGTREPGTYGSSTLGDIGNLCAEEGKNLGITVDFRQSNSEGELVTWIQQSRGNFDGIIINPAAYSHTSVAIYDALLSTELPVIEVHLSNIHKREQFRHHSYVSPAATGIIVGLGPNGYKLALVALSELLSQ